MPAPQEITAVYLRVAERWNKDVRAKLPVHNGEWGAAVCEIVDNGGLAQFVVGKTYDFNGPFVIGELTHKLEYRFSGTPGEFRGTPQFKFVGFDLVAPHSEEAVKAYLQTADHIGNGVANSLWMLYQGDAIERLKADPHGVAAAVRAHYRYNGSFTDQRADVAADFFRRNQANEAATIEVNAVVGGFSIPKTAVKEAVNKWGVGAAKKIRRNPYVLMEHFKGVGFSKADRLYMSLGLPPGRLRRQALCVWNALRSDKSGDTWFPFDKAVSAIRANVGGVHKIRPEQAVRLGVRFGLLAIHIDDAGKKWVALGEYAKQERELAGLILAAMEEENPWTRLLAHPQAQQRLARLSPHQRSELLNCLRGAVCGMTGGPGTGKTFTVAALVNFILDVLGDGVVGITALAGKAAQRSTEAMQEYGIDVRAKTTHSLLKVKRFGRNGIGQEFEFNEGKPLPFDVIIVDEFSLDDVPLALAIFRARKPGAAILLIGDVQQLLPIGHGAVLRDVIAAGIPFARLTETRRNAGTIVRMCEAIGKGLRVVGHDYPIDPAKDGDELALTSRNYKGRFASVESLAPDADEKINLAYLPASNPTETAQKVVEALKLIRDRFASDPVWECQVIVARNEGSAVSRESLNELLQAEFNPGGEKIEGTQFRINDKGVVLENQLLKAFEDGEQTETMLPIFNGEFNKIVAFNEGKIVTRFTGPERTVAVQVGTQRRSEDDSDGDGDEGDGGGENGGKTKAKPKAKANFDLGYAATCHKMQGSQEKWCIYVVDWTYGATREHPFTGISRCVKGGFVVGRLDELNKMVAKTGITKRKTFLKELIEAGRLWSSRAWWVVGEVESPAAASPVLSLPSVNQTELVAT